MQKKPAETMLSEEPVHIAIVGKFRVGRRTLASAIAFEEMKGSD